MSVNMFSQRAVQTSLRRLAAGQPSMMSKSLRFASPSAIATGQIRLAATSAPSSNTTIISSAEGYDILASQRRARPVSPHLTIYKPQSTWIPSILNRITGCILSGGFYIYGFGYLVAPYVGLHWESASVAASFAALPIFAKLLIKAPLAWSFSYHCINGLRHLVWDTGAMFTNKQVIVTSWTILSLSTIVAGGLMFY